MRRQRMQIMSPAAERYSSITIVVHKSPDVRQTKSQQDHLKFQHIRLLTFLKPAAPFCANPD
jgi:hypothetical protein